MLEASAGTGKTSVLVGRYLNLLRVGVDPANILAITFTRQAAAEMRERIIGELRADAVTSAAAGMRWAALRDRLGEIAISTVDAFCLSLLREFPLEADLDPGFSLADETEVPSLIETAVERAVAVAAVQAQTDPDLGSLLAHLGPWRSRAALTELLGRRLVVPLALHRFLTGAPRGLTGHTVCQQFVTRLAATLGGARRALDAFLAAGPTDDARFGVVARDLGQLDELHDADAATIRAVIDRIREFFLTRKGTPRTAFGGGAVSSGSVRRRYRQAAAELAAVVLDVVRAFDRDLNVVLTAAVQRVFGIAVSEYRRALDSRARLDFSDVLQRALELLRHMDEFARSRYRLESRYHHVLVDEFQDTSRAQWELVSLLVRAWGEGSGLVEDSSVPPTVFVVGDRKQSIYRFRDADVTVFDDALTQISGLRPEADVRRSIRHSFRAGPGLLAFVNDLFQAIAADAKTGPGFRYDDHDRFPTDQTASAGDRATSVGLVVASDLETCAERVATEVERLLGEEQVRARDGSGTRAMRAGDIAVLFRARASHREFERALETRSIPTYVYKGLGFFDADEIKDLRALIRFLAQPGSELRAAALLRSRFAGVSDPTIVALAGRLSATLLADEPPAAVETLPGDDRDRLRTLRVGLGRWLGLVDRLPPSEVLDIVIHESAYAYELRGGHVAQARENVKKLRGLVRRLQNHGYATMSRIADQVDHLADDISTAVVEAYDGVNLMTVHAAKGLEFPVVFLVDLGRGTSGRASPVRVLPDCGDGSPMVTVWPYRSTADQAERQKDVEETKRLLYVAVTRARDRLYLSCVCDETGPLFNRGSFGEILPPTLAAGFEQVQRSGVSGVEWTGPSGRRHQLSAVSVDPGEAAAGPTGPRPVVRPADLAPVTDDPWVRVRVTEASARAARSARVDPVAARQDAESLLPSSHGAEAPPARRQTERRVVGRVAHRLLELWWRRDPTRDELERCAVALLRGELPLEGPLVRPLAIQAAELGRRLARHPAVQAVRHDDCVFEVPFVCLGPGPPGAPGRATVETGTIDCLARSSDGRVTVLELKTGSPRPQHEDQLARYVAAVRRLVPSARVEGRLVYV